MDVQDLKISLHPQAQDLLFQHYRMLRRVFSDVLGHLEIDYIGIALLTRQAELFFLSSKPSIEHNIIEYDLWQTEPYLESAFFIKNIACLWSEMYREEIRETLWHYKLKKPAFNVGISVPSFFEEYRVIYSFASQSRDGMLQNRLLNKVDTLVCMGRYCLQNITRVIVLPDRQYSLISRKNYSQACKNSLINN